MGQGLQRLKADALKLLDRMREIPRADGEQLRAIDKQAILALRASGRTQEQIAKIVS